ncbi:hypothetical protein J6590_098982, partial [Homalodisca vitripennis]
DRCQLTNDDDFDSSPASSTGGWGERLPDPPGLQWVPRKMPDHFHWYQGRNKFREEPSREQRGKRPRQEYIATVNTM